MEKLFAQKGIQVQRVTMRNGFEISFAYTDKLLERNILIEFIDPLLASLASHSMKKQRLMH